jgi:hypothetical protein
MKTTFFKSIILLLTVSNLFTLNSCSESEDTSLLTQKETLYHRNDGPGPPTPVVFEGLFDIQLDNGISGKLLFEFPNTVIFGNPTITSLVSLSSCKTTYVNSLSNIYFTINDGFTTYNIKCQFNTVSGDLVGQYGMGIGGGYSDGALTGTKYMPFGVGESLFKGYWIGRYGNGLDVPTNDYTMVLEEFGKFTVAAYPTIYGSSPAVGNYSIIGNNFKGTYTYLFGGQFRCKGVLDATTKRITGTWGFNSSYTNGGTFYLDMQNHL